MTGGNEESLVETIRRSREVGQSFVTSFFTTLQGCIAAIGIVLRHRPKLVLVNGPGTCIPICLAVRVFRSIYLISPCPS